MDKQIDRQTDRQTGGQIEFIYKNATRDYFWLQH